MVKGAGFGAGSADPVILKEQNLAFRIADNAYARLIAAAVREHGAEGTLRAQAL